MFDVEFLSSFFIGCFAKAQDYAVGDVQQTVYVVCQKILGDSLADLWLAAYLILSLEASQRRKV